MEELIELDDVIRNDGLPNPDLVSYYKLEKQRKLYLDLNVDEDVMAVSRMIMRFNIEDKGKPQEERQVIWLYIENFGGDIDFMWHLIDIIEASATPVYTVNLGVSASAAALIFIAGKKRFMMPRAKVVIHEGAANISGDAVKVQDQAEEYKKELKRMKEYILEKTSIPRAMLMKKRNNDWTIDAQYCLENNVCDQIIISLEDVI